MRSTKAGDGQLSLPVECLDPQDRAVLRFTREHHLQGRVRARVQAELGMSQTQCFQLLLALLALLALLGRPEVAGAEPQLTAHLRAMLERRRRLRRWWRSARALALTAGCHLGQRATLPSVGRQGGDGRSGCG